MEIRKYIALFVATIITLSCYSQTQVQSRDVRRISGKAYLYSNGDKFEIIEGVVIAKLKEGKKQVREGIKVIRSHSLGMLEIAVPDNVTVEKYVNILEKTGDFEYVEFDTYIKSCMYPNDPYYLSGDQWGILRIIADGAWEITTGSHSVKVAVIEKDGFELHHPDIDYGNDSYSNISVSDFYNFINVTDSTPANSHGTMVAGIIAAKTNNGTGIAGIAGGNNCEGVKIIPCQVSTSSQLTDAISYAVGKGAKVINMSLETSQCPYLDNAITTAYNNGVTLVCAAGNTGTSQIVYPASNPLTIAVGSTDNNNYWVTDANYGEGLDLVAPGLGYKSTATAADGYYINNVHGTSFAAPHVSGVAALMLSVNPSLTPNNIRSILNTTAIKIRQDTYTYDSSGWNEKVGHGLVNACAAVVAAKHYTISGPNLLCGTTAGTYSISGLPLNFGAIWNIDNSDFTISYLSGNQCYVTYTGSQWYSVANLTATIQFSGMHVGLITKTIQYGTPPFDVIITGGDGSHAHWTSNITGNTVDFQELLNIPFYYPQYEAYLYKMSDSDPYDTLVNHWSSFSSTHLPINNTLSPGWYLIQVQGTNDCGNSDWVEVEIECVDTEMLRANGDEIELSLIYNRQSQILTVTINGATQSRSTIDDTYTIQLWNEMNMLREFKQNDPVVQIPMTGLKSGLYIIRFANKNIVIAKKFMKL